LLEVALKTVPKDLQASTPVSLKATAGLRLLPGDKAGKILEGVTAFLKTYPFHISSNAVAILDGQDEGAFAWLTLNYLLGKLGGGPDATVAAVDLGGGSVQEAFAVTDEEAKSAPSGYIANLKGAGKVYNVYVHSYLGYGLMAGRSKVIEAGSKGAPCFPKGYSSVYKYGGKDYPVEGNLTEPKECGKASVKSLDQAASCGKAQEECSFSGAWRGKRQEGRSYYVSSYFWDRAVDSGIISDAKATFWPTSPKAFGDKVTAACSISSVDIVPSQFPNVKPDAAPFFCLDLTYCHSLLVEGFKLPESSKITLVKQVIYDGKPIEAAWPLGAALNGM
jgi:apyrase